MFGAIVSPERLGNWSGNVGVPGGIPNRTTIFVNVATTTNTRYKCFGDGVTDNLTAIQNAINDCPAGQVVYVPTGTYRLSNQVRIYGKSHWTLRGEGPGKTIFTGGGGAALFAIGQAPWLSEWPATTAITGGATVGSTSITVASTANIQNGQMMFLEQANDGTIVFGFGCGGTASPTYNVNDRMHNNTAVFNHRVMVTSISGTTVNFTPPLPFSFNPSLSPKAVGLGSKFGPQFAGMEDLTVNGNSGGYGVWYQGMYGCWLKNVELKGWGTFGFKFDYVACISIVDCYIHDPASFNWSQGYPLQFDMANNCLVENNIFYKYQAGLMVQGGCGANVIAYNLFFREYDAYLGVEKQMASLYGNHTPYPQFNLWEGNYGNAVQLDFYYGPSRTATFLRNYLHGGDPDVTSERIIMKLDSHQWSNNVVGNILGSSATSSPIYAKMPNLTFTWVQTSPVTWNYDSGTANFSQPTIFRLGYPYSGNNSSVGTANPPSSSQLAYIDLSVKANTIIHGNWDAASRTVKWNPSISDQSIPNSYYLSSKPGWFGNLAWPPYDSSKGSSMTLMNMTNIPAGYRFIFGTNPPTGGVVNQPPVANASASVLIAQPSIPIAFSSSGSFDPEGTPLTYNWTFGDGTTSTAANPSHTYQGIGVYTARLTVSDGVNSATANALVINISLGGGNQPPVAAASGTPANGVAPLAVTFSSAGSSDPEGTALTYSWNFGDGTTSTAANPGHTFSTAGSYAARLTVSDGVNTNLSGNVNITVTAPVNQPPVVAASATPLNGAAPLPVTFSSAGSSDPQGTPLIYNWTFGDGTTSTAANPSHTYQVAGNYAARLTVSDGANTVFSSFIPITVVNPGAGLVAAYGFEEGSGSTVADASGNGNTGSRSGTTWTAQGKYGSALSFNGASDFVVINSSSSLNVSSAMTLEAWVYPTASQSGWSTILHKETDAYYLHASSPAGAMIPAGGAVYNGTESYLPGVTGIPLNTWTHLAVTYDGATMRLYVNGSQVAAKPASGNIQSTANPLRIGGNVPFGQYFQGRIDEVRVYNRTLGPSELVSDMNNPVIVTEPKPPAPLLHPIVE